MDIGTRRGNKYEVRYINIGPNALGVHASEDQLFGVVLTERVLPQDLFTPEELAQHHAYCTMVERIIERVIDREEKELEIDGLKSPRAKVHELLNQAQEAKRLKQQAELEAARIETENIVKRSEHEELERNLATMRTSLKGNG